MNFKQDGRSLIVTHENGQTFRVLPTSETSGPTTSDITGPYKNSTTWRWEYDGVHYGVQIRTQTQGH